MFVRAHLYLAAGHRRQAGRLPGGVQRPQGTTGLHRQAQYAHTALHLVSGWACVCEGPLQRGGGVHVFMAWCMCRRGWEM